MIKTFDYQKSLREIEPEIISAITRVLRSNRLILGPETEAFEREFAAHANARYCIAVASGTTALHLALLALGIGPGDEVLTVSNTCVPTIAAIRLTGASPVFVDVREDDLMMDADGLSARVTSKTRCILPVHLWGKSVDLEPVLKVAERHGLAVVEDCAQAHGTRYRGRATGTYGQAGCFSFYPTKNLGSYGDAGAVVTNDDGLAARLRRLRVYGYDAENVAREEGMNARVAEMQAAVLRVKLRVFADWLGRRLQVAAFYDERITNPLIAKPRCLPSCSPSYHQYVIRSSRRDELARWLHSHEIGFGIHYPTPVHLMPAYSFLGGSRLDLPRTVKAAAEILSLPIHEALEPDEMSRVADTLNRFA